MNTFIKENKYIIGVFFVIFLCLFVFFTQAHPLVPYDGDDWGNLSNTRKALPSTGQWNPIKIFPEVVFPFMGLIAAYLVYPITGQYIYAIMYVSAFLLSCIITIYIGLFYNFIIRLFNLQKSTSLLLTAIFFLFHFWVFQLHGDQLSHFFSSENLTCIYHYVLPAIINMSLILWFKIHEISGDYDIFKNPLQSGCLILAIYLAIFSNILSSIIISSYIIFMLLKDMHVWHNLKAYIIKNKFFLIILLVWLVSLFMESQGGRAKSIGIDIMHLPIQKTAFYFIDSISHINKALVSISILPILGSLVIYIKTKEKTAKEYTFLFNFVCFVICSVLTSIYLILISAKASPGYIERSDVIIVVIFWYLLLIFNSMSYLISKKTETCIILPIVAFIILSFIINGHVSYHEVTMGRVNAETCVQIDNDLIDQITQADKAGKNAVILHVPKGDNRDNWPHPRYLGDNISRTLYFHGITTKRMKITIQPDISMNQKYHLPIQ